jgi:hypothetical protein
MEDALKKLDSLTQEEARMAAAQNLKATHTVDERVKGVGHTAEAIINKVASVDDQVGRFDGRIARVDESSSSRRQSNSRCRKSSIYCQ